MLRPLVQLEGGRWAWTASPFRGWPLGPTEQHLYPIVIVGSHADVICELLHLSSGELSVLDTGAPRKPGLYAQPPNTSSPSLAVYLLCIPPTQEDVLASSSRISAAACTSDDALQQQHAHLQRQLLGLACMLSSAVVVHMGQEGSPEFAHGAQLVHALNAASRAIHTSSGHLSRSHTTACTLPFSLDDPHDHERCIDMAASGHRPQRAQTADTHSLDPAMPHHAHTSSLPQLLFLVQTDVPAASSTDVVRALEGMAPASSSTVATPRTPCSWSQATSSKSSSWGSDPSTYARQMQLSSNQSTSGKSWGTAAAAVAAASIAGCTSVRCRTVGSTGSTAAHEQYRTACSQLLEEVLHQCAVVGIGSGASSGGGSAGLQASLQIGFADVDVIPVPISKQPLSTYLPQASSASSRASTSGRPMTAKPWLPSCAQAEAPPPPPPPPHTIPDTPLSRALAALGRSLDGHTPQRVVQGQVLTGQLLYQLGTAFTELCTNTPYVNAFLDSHPAAGGAPSSNTRNADQGSGSSAQLISANILSLFEPQTPGSSQPLALIRPKSSAAPASAPELGGQSSAALPQAPVPSRFAPVAQPVTVCLPVRRIPSLDQAWAYMAQVERRDAMDAAFDEYMESMKPGMYLGQAEQQIDALHRRAWAAVRKEFLDRTAHIPDEVGITHFRELKSKCEEHLAEVKRIAVESPPPLMRAPSRGGRRVSLSGAAFYGSSGEVAASLTRCASRARGNTDDFPDGPASGGVNGALMRAASRSRMASRRESMAGGGRDLSPSFSASQKELVDLSAAAAAALVSGPADWGNEGRTLFQSNTSFSASAGSLPQLRKLRMSESGNKGGLLLNRLGSMDLQSGQGYMLGRSSMSVSSAMSPRSPRSQDSPSRITTPLPLIHRPQLDDGLVKDARRSFAFWHRVEPGFEEGGATALQPRPKSDSRLAAVSHAIGMAMAARHTTDCVVPSSSDPAGDLSDPLVKHLLGGSSQHSTVSSTPTDTQSAPLPILPVPRVPSSAALTAASAFPSSLRPNSKSGSQMNGSGPGAQLWVLGSEGLGKESEGPQQDCPSTKLSNMLDAWDKQGSSSRTRRLIETASRSTSSCPGFAPPPRVPATRLRDA